MSKYEVYDINGNLIGRVSAMNYITAWDRAYELFDGAHEVIEK